MKAGGTMSTPFLRRDQLKAGTLLRSKEDGSLTMILEDPATGFESTGFVPAYDFRKRKHIQLNTGYIHARIVGGGA
tara:strand:+ start:133 stop:360 length:228 start_codon:yes stop_codon:yes gene_type:complete